MILRISHHLSTKQNELADIFKYFSVRNILLTFAKLSVQ